MVRAIKSGENSVQLAEMDRVDRRATVGALRDMSSTEQGYSLLSTLMSELPEGESVVIDGHSDPSRVGTTHRYSNWQVNPAIGPDGKSINPTSETGSLVDFQARGPAHSFMQSGIEKTVPPDETLFHELEHALMNATGTDFLQASEYVEPLERGGNKRLADAMRSIQNDPRYLGQLSEIVAIEGLSALEERLGVPMPAHEVLSPFSEQAYREERGYTEKHGGPLLGDLPDAQ